MKKETILKIGVIIFFIFLSYIIGKASSYEEGYQKGYTFGLNESYGYKYEVLFDAKYLCRQDPNNSVFINFTEEQIKEITSYQPCDHQIKIPSRSIHISEYPQIKNRLIVINLTDVNQSVNFSHDYFKSRQMPEWTVYYPDFTKSGSAYDQMYYPDFYCYFGSSDSPNGKYQCLTLQGEN